MSKVAVDERYAGCHGILVEPSPLGEDLGWCSQRPPVAARVHRVEPSPPVAGRTIWRASWPAGEGRPALRMEILHQGRGRVWVSGSHTPSMLIDTEAAVVTVGGGDRGLYLQALVGLALPMIAQARGAALLHGAAAVRGDTATLICGDTGRGKSTLLVGLVRAGWSALSEDICVVHRTDSPPRLWPGPEWVRLTAGAPRPALSHRFGVAWKEAWDLAPHMHRRSARIARIVFLERLPSGAPRLTSLNRSEAIRALSNHCFWFAERRRMPMAVFPWVVRLTGAAPAFTLALPYSEHWVDDAAALLMSAPAAALAAGA